MSSGGSRWWIIVHVNRPQVRIFKLRWTLENAVTIKTGRGPLRVKDCYFFQTRLTPLSRHKYDIHVSNSIQIANFHSFYHYLKNGKTSIKWCVCHYVQNVSIWKKVIVIKHNALLQWLFLLLIFSVYTFTESHYAPPPPLPVLGSGVHVFDSFRIPSTLAFTSESMLLFSSALSSEPVVGFWPNFYNYSAWKGKELIVFWWSPYGFQAHNSTWKCHILTKIGSSLGRNHVFRLCHCDKIKSY